MGNNNPSTEEIARLLAAAQQGGASLNWGPITITPRGAQPSMAPSAPPPQPPQPPQPSNQDIMAALTQLQQQTRFAGGQQSPYGPSMGYGPMMPMTIPMPIPVPWPMPSMGLQGMMGSPWQVCSLSFRTSCMR